MATSTRRLYAPFWFDATAKRWCRLTTNRNDLYAPWLPAFPKEQACQFYQGWLLDGVLNVGERRELRPVKSENQFDIRRGA